MQKPPLLKIVIVQTVILGVLACVLLPFGKTTFVSCVCGIMIALLPQIFFSRKAFAYQGALFAGKIVRNFFIAEFYKILMTSVGFAIVFIFVRPLHAYVVIYAFIASQCLCWLANLFLCEPQPETGLSHSKKIVNRG